MISTETNACNGNRLYESASSQSLTRQQRWQLDTELLNEVGMKSHNSRRFDAPGSFAKRAAWAESMARWYPTADLIQQLVDFRASRTRNDEEAFGRLVELGRRGDIGAQCLAAALYKHFPDEVTSQWRYRYEELVRAAVLLQPSGHPVCAAVQASVLLTGHAGYPRDRAKAKPFLIESAVAGLYGSQTFLSGMHLEGSSRFRERDVALRLCWQRVADAQSPIASFQTTCEAYRLGIAADSGPGDIALPPGVQRLAAEWCAPTRVVEAQECAALESDSDRGEGGWSNELRNVLADGREL